MSTTNPTWSSTGIYTKGMIVTEAGVVYVANWWTQGNDPAKNNGGTGTGQPWTIVPPGGQTPVPGTPGNLSAVSTTSSSATLTWSAATVAGGGTVTGYAVYQNGTQVGTATGTSYTATGLTAYTAYTFTVAAIDSAGASPQTGALSVTTPAGSSTPVGNAPAWNAAAIYTSGMTASENGIVYRANWWTQNNDPLANNGAAGSGKVWTAIGKVNTTPTAPDAPTGLTATALSSSAVALFWTAATVQGSGTVSGYAVFENGKQIATTTDTHFTVGSLAASTGYSFSVQAIDATGASPSSTAASATTLAAGAAAPAVTFAPYVDMSLYPSPNLVAISQASGIKTFTLAFIQSSGTGTIGWGGIGTIAKDGLPDGSTILSQIQALRAIGGNVMISFGGAAGTDPAAAAGVTAAGLQAEYQSVIDRYGVSSLDFDIEGAQVADQAAIKVRDQALVGLEKANPGLQVSFTLPVLPTGLDSNGVNVITAAAKDGVGISVINIMAMDYGSSVDNGGAMGLDAIDAIKATEQQVARVGLAAKIGVTPMIGVNDTASEVFTLADAQQLATYAASDPDVARLSMWSVARDNGSGAGASYASATSSGIAQNAYQFSSILHHI